MLRESVLAIGITASTLAAAEAAPIPVGSGANSALLVFNWADGGTLQHVVEYEVSFDGTLNGYTLAVLADDADDDLSLSWSEFDFGSGLQHFLDIATYDAGGTTFVGDGATFDFATAPENYWHYYTDPTGSGAWGFSSVGPDLSTVSDGTREAWVFGTAALPVPEPATAALVAGGLLALGRRRG